MKWPRIRTLALVAAVLVAVMPQAAEAQTVVAASFANRSGEASLDWIGESIGETIRAALDREQVPVVPREERDQYSKRLSLKPGAAMTLASLLKVADAASAGLLVWGDYEVPVNAENRPVPSGQTRITVRVYDRAKAIQRLSWTTTGNIEDLVTLERSVAWAVFHELRPASKVTRAEFDGRHPLRRLNARESYVRGLMASTDEQRYHYFTAAVRMDPAFDEALLELGLMGWRTEDFAQAANWLSRVGTGAANYLTALFLLGCSQFHEGDSAAAMRSFSELALRAPDSREVRNNLAAAQLPFDAAGATEAFAKLVTEAPEDPDYLFNYGYALWSQGEFERAAETFRQVLDRTPNEADSILMLGRCLKKSGPRPGDLRAAGLQRLIEEWPGAGRVRGE